MKMRLSGNAIRWWALAAITAVVLLIRIYRQEWLQGMNPLLILFLPAGLYVAWRLTKK